MARNRTPVMAFEGGPLHGRRIDKRAGGRWQTYVEPRLDPDGLPIPVRTDEGANRVVRRMNGDPVTFYRLDDAPPWREAGRFGRTYVFCTLLEERARRAARAADAAAAAAAAAVSSPAAAPAFIAPTV